MKHGPLGIVEIDPTWQHLHLGDRPSFLAGSNWHGAKIVASICCAAARIDLGSSAVATSNGRGTIMELAEAEWESVDVEEVCISRAVDGQAGLYRDFTAQVVVFNNDADESLPLGVVSGWIGWHLSWWEIFDGADAISSDAERMGSVAGEIHLQHARRPKAERRNVILLDTVEILPEAHNHRTLARVIEQLGDVLQLEPDRTLVTVFCDPENLALVDAEGSLWSPEAATGALGDAGFLRWKDTDVWWRLLQPAS